MRFTKDPERQKRPAPSVRRLPVRTFNERRQSIFPSSWLFRVTLAAKNSHRVRLMQFIFIVCAWAAWRMFGARARKTIECAPINSARTWCDVRSRRSHQLTNQAKLATREAPRLPPPPLDPNIEFHCNNSLTWQNNAAGGMVCVCVKSRKSAAAAAVRATRA